MISEKDISKALQIILYTAFLVFVLFYELPKVLDEQLNTANAKFSYKEISNLFEILGVVLSSYTLLISFRSRWLLKLILQDDFIDGSYEGHSYEENNTNRQIEVFNIKQTLISTTIHGQSFKNENFYSSWQGKLIEYTNSEYKFLVHLNTPNRNNALEYLVLSIQGDQCNGFGILIEGGTRTPSVIEAKLKSA
ncbi:hypothetical protein [Spirosoma aerophilum]